MSRRRRLLLYSVGVLVVLEIVWLLAFEWAARSGRLERWVARRPDRFVLEFDRAHSWFPLHVRLEGIRLAVRTPRWQWRVEADSAQGIVSPWPLLSRKLRFGWLAGKNVAFQARRSGPGPETPTSAPLRPEIPEFAGLTGELQASSLSPTPWSFDFPHLEIDDLREVWIDQIRILGQLSAEGGFAIRDRSTAEVHRSTIHVGQATIELAGNRLATRISGEIRGGLDRYRYREERGLLVLPHLSARSDLRGEFHDQGLLRRFAAGADWLDLDRASVPFTARLRIESGVLAPGTRMVTTPSPRTIGLFGFEIEGEAGSNFEVINDDGPGPLARFETRFGAFAVRRKGFERPLIAGHDLTLNFRSRDLDLTRRPTDTRMTLDLGSARIPDLAVFGPLLPTASGLELRGGEGDVHARLEIDLQRGDARGGLSAVVERAEAKFAQLAIDGRLDVEVPISSRDLRGRRFDLAGSRFELSRFRVRDATRPTLAADDDWWATAIFPQAEIELTPEGELSGAFALRMRDSAPLVELYSARRELPRWTESLLAITDLEATGRLSWRPGDFRLESFETVAENSAIHARMGFTETEKRGRILLEWRRLALGIEVRNGQRDFKLFGARDWYGR